MEIVFWWLYHHHHHYHDCDNFLYIQSFFFQFRLYLDFVRNLSIKHYKILYKTLQMCFFILSDQLEIQWRIGGRITGMDQGDHRGTDQHIRRHRQLFRSAQGRRPAVQADQLHQTRFNQKSQRQQNGIQMHGKHHR